MQVVLLPIIILHASSVLFFFHLDLSFQSKYESCDSIGSMTTLTICYYFSVFAFPISTITRSPQLQAMSHLCCCLCCFHVRQLHGKMFAFKKKNASHAKVVKLHQKEFKWLELKYGSRYNFTSIYRKNKSNITDKTSKLQKDEEKNTLTNARNNAISTKFTTETYMIRQSFRFLFLPMPIKQQKSKCRSDSDRRPNHPNNNHKNNDHKSAEKCSFIENDSCAHFILASKCLLPPQLMLIYEAIAVVFIYTHP